MKKIILILFVFSQLLIFCKPQKVVSQNIEKILFAKIKLGKIVFIKDTIKFKKKISKSIFSKETNVNFNKVEILTQNYISDNKSKKIFYYVIMYDYKNKLKTARVLNLNNDELFFTKNNAFEQTYISCIGKKFNCKPKIFYDKSKWFWACGDNLSECLVNSNDECKVFHTVLF